MMREYDGPFVIKGSSSLDITTETEEVKRLFGQPLDPPHADAPAPYRYRSLILEFAGQVPQGRSRKASGTAQMPSLNSSSTIWLSLLASNSP